MILRRCFTNLPASPISGVEFIEALKRVWKPGQNASPNLGLAVSGGVDSMALALLCAREISWRGDMVAFVVDHAARKDSGDEADRVVDLLQRQLGMQAHKLTVKWPEGTEPLELSNFETLARKLRFRALGNACADNDIDTLLLGHHQDDQAETVLMRLSNAAASYGLKGMAISSNVPECQGIHGVHESHRHSMTSGVDGPTYDLQDWTPPPPEFGGVRLARPLLAFGKDRLVATCRYHNVGWFEDHTNADRTLTHRNAVRHIFQSFTLPQALSKTAMLETSTRAVQEQATVEEVAEAMFSSSKLRLDTRIGTLTVTLPDKGDPNWGPKPYGPERRQRMAAFAYVNRLVRIVTPLEVVETDQLRNAVKTMYPQMSPSPPDASAAERTSAFLICAGVLFQRLADRTWQLTRALPRSNGAQSFNISIARPTDALTPVLFDNRYWIRVQCNEIRRPLVVRFMREYDIPNIRRYFADKSRRHLRKLEAVRSALDPSMLVTSDALVKNKRQLATLKRLRGVVPVIAIADKDGDVNATMAERHQSLQDGKAGLGAGSVVALPSLGIALTDLFKDEWAWLQTLRYMVRYRKVDFGSHDKTQVLDVSRPGASQSKTQQRVERAARRFPMRDSFGSERAGEVQKSNPN